MAMATTASKEETTMQSNNPIFRRNREFQPGGNIYGNQTYMGNGSAYQGYGQPVGGVQGPVGGTSYAPASTSSGPMPIDSVVQKTAISLGIVIIAAVVTWMVTPEISGQLATTANIGSLYAAMTIGGLGAFALSMVNSFKRVVSPPLVMIFCVFEGISLGAYSKFFDALYANDGKGLITGAVLGTFAAFAGTLAAYKFFNIQVGAKFRMFVISAVFGMVGLSIMELVLGAFGHSTGLFGFGGLGMVTAVIGLALGVFMLILDFDFVEQGIANGLPEAESWRAAFALTVSLVWIYTNLLRLLAIFGDR